MTREIDRPAPCEVTTLYGSDAMAEMLRRLDMPYVALNPGSSFRGLHDSMVNYLGNQDPHILLCLHEEHAVAIAHGWAKITGRPLAVVLHANVGLMHAAMAVYNAWCDRVPMLILGATGPVDAAKRRPWIDWLHTSRDQAAVVRPYVKWDDQPASLAASLSSMMRAMTITTTAPTAPTYVCFDVTVQETAIEAMPTLPDPVRHAAPAAPVPSRAQVAMVAAMLAEAKAPVFLMGRVSRDPGDWARRVALAEHLGVRVVTDIKTGAAFPTRHALHAGAPGFFLSAESVEVLKDADLILCLDWVDPAGTLSQAAPLKDGVRVVNATLEPMLSNGWSMDHQDVVASDLPILCEPDALVAALCETLGIETAAAAVPQGRAATPAPHGQAPGAELSLDALAHVLRAALAQDAHTLVRLPLGWDGRHCDFTGPLDYLGYDGGAGISSGPGMVVGAALALKDTGRMPVAVLGDGDFIMGATALWTGTHHQVPMLVVVANNRSYFNDEIHQERVARVRDRPVGNKHIGQAIDEPDIDIAGLARAQGAEGRGPVSTVAEFEAALAQALPMVRTGKAVVIDARILRGYVKEMAEGMTAEQED
ncbi:thiamine pyrophosphate-binding protein [Paracoccus marcusii]|uniref:thiamine pyrophosphate-binding protein n=1 Tax=Paracoccus marcusii TaxID=59779 RepID=UPI0035A6868A